MTPRRRNTARTSARKTPFSTPRRFQCGLNTSLGCALAAVLGVALAYLLAAWLDCGLKDPQALCMGGAMLWPLRRSTHRPPAAQDTQPTAPRLPGPSLLRPPPSAAQERARSSHLISIVGALATDAHIEYSAGTHPRAWLRAKVHPPRGLPYLIKHDLGTNAADHMVAHGQLHYLRQGALVVATGRWLNLRADHADMALMLMDCSMLRPYPGPVDMCAAHSFHQAAA